MKSIKHLILMTALLGITGSVSQVYAMERDEPAGGEEESKKSIEQREARIAQANKDLLEEAFAGNFEGVKKALDDGADPNTRNEIKQTALHSAPNIEIVQLLIAQGADVNAKDWSGLTPLHNARDGAIAAALLQAGASVNAQTSSNNSTPLHLACIDFVLDGEQTKKEVINVLLAAGADPNIKNQRDRSSRTALEDFVIQLTRHFPDNWSWPSEQDQSIISKLIGAGAKPFDMSMIRHSNLRQFVNDEFKKALLKESLPAALHHDISPMIIEYLDDKPKAGAARR